MIAEDLRQRSVEIMLEQTRRECGANHDALDQDRPTVDRATAQNHEQARARRDLENIRNSGRSGISSVVSVSPPAGAPAPLHRS